MPKSRSCRTGHLLPFLTAVLLLAAGPASSTSFDFDSNGGPFTIAGTSLSFGSGLTISSASTEAGDADASLVDAVLDLDPILLTGETVFLQGGLQVVVVDNTIDYTFRILERPEDGGALVASASYDPGEFFAVFSVSFAEIQGSVSNLVVAQPGLSAAIDELAATAFPVSLSVRLAARGFDITAGVDSGDLVAGSVDGSVATVVPEPDTVLLVALGLAGFAQVPLAGTATPRSPRRSREAE